ncbi:MAG: DUF2804 domain-containing protein [Firmicutes bacterium]|nr:DUF2804 domain-containing protein [Bacillota bacterium]
MEQIKRQQHEIKQHHALLDENGHLIEPGYTKGLLMDYDRSKIKGGAMRIKEWDYYLVTTRDFAVALTIDDNSYMGLDSISLLDFGKRWEHTNSPMAFFTGGKKNFPAGSDKGDVKTAGKGYSISFEHKGDHRLLKFHMDDFCGGNPIDGEIRLENPQQESMVIVTPFAEKKTAFYYNQKINCLKAFGKVTFAGSTYDFNRPDAYGVLDWGRGVWTYNNTWYWGSASGTVEMPADRAGEAGSAGTTVRVPFGWNIGYGFGDTSAATENMLFCGGKAHKLSEVTFNIPQKDGKDDFLSPWTFTSDDGRFEMDFKPILDRAACTDFKILCSDQHQVFGLYSGKAVLDDGTVIEVKDFLGFAEKVHNKW